MIKGRTSVLIAAYNARYLRGALESVAKQTYRNISIIVRDDNRTEAVCDVINAFKAQRGLPIDYERNAEQLGVRRNYERCFADADGEYIKFLNDDDLLDPPCIERLVAALEPRWLRIGGYWYPRGGIPIDVFWQTGAPPANLWLPEQGVASYRGRG